MSYTGYGPRLQATLDREGLLSGKEIQRLANSKRLQKAEKEGEKTRQEIQKNNESRRRKDEMNERERQKKQELNRFRRAQEILGAKRPFTGETKKEFLPPVAKTKGGRVVIKPEQKNPADEEKRHKNPVDPEIQRKAKEASKWFDEIQRNNQRSNTILDSLRKTLKKMKKMKLPSIK